MNSPYLIIPIGIFFLLLYLLSHILVRSDILPKSTHRKLWNVVLLIAFLVAAIIGILLAIQINYRLEWTFIESALKWHVNFGIVLSIVAIIHLLWHIDYYVDIFRNGRESLKEKKTKIITPVSNPEKLKPLIILSGFIATVIQVLLLREITTVFQGNEIMMGWTIGAWMLLTGSGAFLGRSSIKISNGDITLCNILSFMGIIPIVSIILMNVLKNSLFPPGIIINPVYFLLLLILLLAPIALLSGYTFSLLVKLYRKNNDDFIKVYALESLGSLAGGLLVTFVFIYWFSVLQSLFAILLIISITLYIYKKKNIHIISISIALILLVSSFIFHFDTRLKSLLFINQRIAESRETFYGNLTVTENAGQYSFYENGSLLFTSDNTVSNEEYVHYAMLQKERPRKVLLVGGGIAGMLPEILKYHTVAQVDYVDINPHLIRIASKYLPMPEDQRINLIVDDGRRFLQRSKGQYDVAILALPDPSSLQINRFYTQEFIGILKKNLTANAVVLFSHSAGGNYITTEKAGMEAAIYNTLKTGFSNVEIIPGEEDYFIGSDTAISIQVSALSSQREIENVYVNPYYIDDFSIQQRSQFVKQNLESEDIINSDSMPLPVFLHSLQFLSLFDQKSAIIIIVPVILLILPVFFMRRVTSGIFIAGFTASSLELLLIFSFQTFAGYVYSAIGLIVAVFMGGLAAGSILSYRFQIRKKHFITAQSLLVIYSLLFPIFWYVQKGIGTGLVSLVTFLLATFILSSILGFQYVAGTRLLDVNPSKSAPSTYASDLLGSALGIIAITVILLPTLGMTNSCLVIAGFNVIAVVLNISQKT
ncbi:fused MFS/spermidine synthase [Bacteroidota bacterium]